MVWNRPKLDTPNPFEDKTLIVGHTPVALFYGKSNRKIVDYGRTLAAKGEHLKIEHAEGLDECKKMLLLAKAGKKNGCLIEGMGCPGGCIAGAGTNIPILDAKREVTNFVKNSSKKLPPKELQDIELL